MSRIEQHENLFKRVGYYPRTVVGDIDDRAPMIVDSRHNVNPGILASADRMDCAMV